MKALHQLFCVLNSPVSVQELNGLLVGCNHTLPTRYLEFLSEANGAESCIHDIGGDCLALWRAGEIIETNEDYGITRRLPELIVIGSDGGGDAIGLDRLARSNPDEWPVIRIGFGNLDRADFVRQPRSFAEWWQQEFALRR